MDCFRVTLFLKMPNFIPMNTEVMEFHDILLLTFFMTLTFNLFTFHIFLSPLLIDPSFGLSLKHILKKTTRIQDIKVITPHSYFHL